MQLSATNYQLNVNFVYGIMTQMEHHRARLQLYGSQQYCKGPTFKDKLERGVIWLVLLMHFFIE